jgi:hypothetical protein
LQRRRLARLHRLSQGTADDAFAAPMKKAGNIAGFMQRVVTLT